MRLLFSVMIYLMIEISIKKCYYKQQLPIIEIMF